jgi:hypothetical protein
MPTPQQYRKYSTQYAGAQESLGWVWWDTVTYTSGTTTTLTLFNAIRATRDLGNMELAGAFPFPKGFLIRVIRFFLKGRPRSIARAASTNPNTGQLDNVAQLINTGHFELTVGNKSYLQVPLWMLTSGGGASGIIALQGATADPGAAIDYAQNGIADPRAVYSLTRPIFIEPQINFFGTLAWPAAVTLTGDHTLCIALDGDIVRQVQ